MQNTESLGQRPELSPKPEKVRMASQEIQREELDIKNPETDTYAGYVLGCAVITKGIKLEDLYNNPEEAKFSTDTEQLAEAPSYVSEAFGSLVSEPVQDIYAKMGIDPKTEDALFQCLNRFTKAGITVTKAYAEQLEDEIKYTTLEPNATPEEVVKFIGLSQPIKPEIVA